MENVFNMYKFYNGEKECPVKVVDDETQNKAMLWFYEQVHAQEGDRKENIEEYEAYGLKNFSRNDSRPEGFKALLFNRYMKGAYSVSAAIPEFKAFYKKYYG